jgi:hypothetical protein
MDIYFADDRGDEKYKLPPAGQAGERITEIQSNELNFQSELRQPQAETSCSPEPYGYSESGTE